MDGLALKTTKLCPHVSNERLALFGKDWLQGIGDGALTRSSLALFENKLNHSFIRISNKFGDQVGCDPL